MSNKQIAFRAFMKEHGYKKANLLADAIGITPSQLSWRINDRTELLWSEAKKMAAALNVSLDELAKYL